MLYVAQAMVWISVWSREWGNEQCAVVGPIRAVLESAISEAFIAYVRISQDRETEVEF